MVSPPPNGVPGGILKEENHDEATENPPLPRYDGKVKEENRNEANEKIAVGIGGADEKGSDQVLIPDDIPGISEKYMDANISNAVMHKCSLLPSKTSNRRGTKYSQSSTEAGAPSLRGIIVGGYSLRKDRKSFMVKGSAEMTAQQMSKTKKQKPTNGNGFPNCLSSGKTDSTSCRRSKRLKEKLKPGVSANSAYIDEKQSRDRTCSPVSSSSCLDESDRTCDSDSDMETTDSSYNEFPSIDSAPQCFSQTRKSSRLRNLHGKVSGAFDGRAIGTMKYGGPRVKKIKMSNGVRGVEDVEGTADAVVVDDGDHLDSKVGHEDPLVDSCGVTDKILCSICQIGAASNFILKCVGIGCSYAFHTFCLLPPLIALEKDWLCPYCKGQLSRDQNQMPKKVQKIVGCKRVLIEHTKNSFQDQFLLKWESLSHHHDSWAPLEWIYAIDRVRLFKYQKKNVTMDGAVIVDQRKPEWLNIDRVIAIRTKDSSDKSCDILSLFLLNKRNGDLEYLVKWMGLDYCDATWESSLTEDLSAEVGRLVRRHQKAVERTDSYFQKCNDLQFDKSPGYLGCGVLYNYQLEGLNWILRNFMTRRNIILADEMGLGKTVQVVSFIQCMKQENLSSNPVLIIAPKSILFHWEKEFRHWAQDLNVLIYQGDKASRHCIQMHELYSSGKVVLFDALVTNYELVLLDSTIFKKFSWSCIIIDEGHKIKNLGCKLASVLKHYTSDFRLLLTGTPLQNTLLELFALLHFLDPEEFSDPKAKAKSFSEIGTGRCYEETLKISELHELLRPRMLRRMKSDVLPRSIPAKKWVEVPCALTNPQRNLYIDILEKNYNKLNEGIQSGKKIVLNFILMQLKKCCNHPYLFTGQEQSHPSRESVLDSMIGSSGKLQLLKKLLPKLKERGNRVLLFSQMTKMLDILEDFLVFLRLPYFRIDGATTISVRLQQMREFNDPESKVFVFLISTRAGGLGIDLPAADRVIIYDPDFNPFMDLQAQSRAHRIGQTRPVVVYQLITKGTVEEKILQKSKKKLAVENLVMNHSRKPDVKDLHSTILHGAQKIRSRKTIPASGIHYDDDAIEALLKLDPAPGEKCVSDENGYLGSIHSFLAEADDEPPPPSPKVQDWKEILGPVEEEKDRNLGRGKRQKKAVKYVCDSESDNDEIYSPDSSSVSASSNDSQTEVYDEL